MSVSDKSKNFKFFIENDSGWADFFVTRIGLILFTAILLLAAFQIYPMFQEREILLSLDAETSDICSKIEAVDSMTIPGYKYNYVFNDIDSGIRIDLSTEYVTAYKNMSSSLWGDLELSHPEPVITHVYPPNSRWKNSSGFRKYLSDTIGEGKNGDVSSPLRFSDKKEEVDLMFESIKKELARDPYSSDLNRPMFIEKVIIYYDNQTEIQQRDYVFVYQ